MDKVRKLLEVEIEDQFGDLGTLEPGSVEQLNAITNVDKLYRILIEEDRLKSDEMTKASQMKNENRNRYIQFGLEAVGIVLPIVFYSTWMRRGFKFEETGSFTSTTFRGLFSRFRPTK